MKRFSLAIPAGQLVNITVILGVCRQKARRNLGPAVQWFRRGLPLAVEAIMLVGSSRLSYTLLSNQKYFDRFPGPYDWIVSHGTPWCYEWVWGFVAGISAVLKAIGILLCVVYRRDPVMADLGYGIRLIAWLASCVIWGAFAISFSIWDPLAVNSIAASCAFALAFWGLCMGPAMPDDENG